MGVWLPPGVVVPISRASEPLTLEAREIMGHISNGMLASPHELAITSMTTRALLKLTRLTLNLANTLLIFIS